MNHQFDNRFRFAEAVDAIREWIEEGSGSFESGLTHYAELFRIDRDDLMQEWLLRHGSEHVA